MATAILSSSSCPPASADISRGHAAAAGGAQPRRRHRFGVRRPRAVRALPGAGGRRRIRQARRVLLEREPVAVQRAGDALRAARAAGGRPAPVLLGAGRRPTWSSTCPRAARCIARWCARKPMRAPSSCNPVVRLHYVQVKQPDMHDPSGDLRRLFEALEANGASRICACDLSVLQMLQPALRAGAGRSRWPCTPRNRSSASGPDCMSASTASRSTSVRPPSPRICAI